MRGLCAFAIGFVGACNSVFDIEDTKPRPQDQAQFNPRTLVFDNSASAIDLVDFPLFVSLDASRVEYFAVVDPTTDLRFEADGVELPFEIEHWEPNGLSAVWVKVPLISAGSRSDRILMYYGPEARGTEDPAAVWTSYELVLHCDGDFHATVGATLNEMGDNVVPVIGQVSGAASFNGAGGERLTYGTTVPILAAWPKYTFETWLYADYASSTEPAGSEPRFFDSDGALTLGRLLQSGDPYVFREQLDTHYQGSGAGCCYEQIEVPPRQWFQLVQTFDGASQLIYRDAIVADDVAFGVDRLTVPGASGVVLGGSGGAESMRGMVDEVRISSKAYPQDWIEAQYKAMTGSFLTVYMPGQAPTP